MLCSLRTLHSFNRSFHSRRTVRFYYVVHTYTHILFLNRFDEDIEEIAPE